MLLGEGDVIEGEDLGWGFGKILKRAVKVADPRTHVKKAVSLADPRTHLAKARTAASFVDPRNAAAAARSRAASKSIGFSFFRR